jgi:exodeoxyribonuclease VII small subunit
MAKKNITFEAATDRLEEILNRLESGDCELSESLKLYEEGISLIRSCNELLEKAEQSVKMLQVQPDGTATLVDFAKTED